MGLKPTEADCDDNDDIDADVTANDCHVRPHLPQSEGGGWWPWGEEEGRRNVRRGQVHTMHCTRRFGGII